MTPSAPASEARFSIPGATVECRVAGAPPPAPPARSDEGRPLVRLGDDGLEFASKERLVTGQRVILTVNAPGRRAYLKLIGEVASVQPDPSGAGHHVEVRFSAHSAGMAHRIHKLRKGYASLDAPSAAPPAGSTAEKAVQEPVAELESVEAEGTSIRSTAPPPRLPRISERDLAAQLRTLAVDERFAMDVLEACEMGINLDGLYKTEATRKTDGPAGPEATVNPLPVYPWNKDIGIEFDENWVPKAAPVSYVSVPFADENCFACQLGADDMDGPEGPNFKPGDIVVFSTTEPVATGDFALVLTSSGCVFREVAFSAAKSDGGDANNRQKRAASSAEMKDAVVQLRPLNDRYEPRSLRRAEVRGMWKMIGRCERYG